MLSSTPSDKLFCQIRKTYVSATPEEKVRQGLVTLMTEKLGYPLGSLAIEKSLVDIPLVHLANLEVPLRRADLIVFSPGIHSQDALYPLLLIEFKAIKMSPKEIRQIIGYNNFLKAYFIALVNQDEIRFGIFDPIAKEYAWFQGLPTYQELLAMLQS